MKRFVRAILEAATSSTSWSAGPSVSSLRKRPILCTAVVGILPAALLAHSIYKYKVKDATPTTSFVGRIRSTGTMSITEPFQCEACVKDVSDTLHKLQGISKVEANLKDQLVLVEGTGAASAGGHLDVRTAPSTIVKAIQSTGKDAILRGSGAANNLAVSGVSAGSYRATIREYGDLKDGATSTGPVWGSASSEASNASVGEAKGFLGTIDVDQDGQGSGFLTHPFQVWEVIGHAMVFTRQDDAAGSLKNDEDTLTGIVARSAGIWENDKTVCSCSGKTLWEERQDEVKKGMM
ncbi:unnamed protein product [Parascedosporium putredinis]|uniref:Superoxide dismutase 1 copper chaperone n=1 Tax=Parascedosporium putredinis TaxID=1442378 RepID=A0A9P1MFR2_9PEZI|nr:unnamed protein product [Parascedosporium putredinis]CAI8002942.1 unnamed protein product [Parascedosporium putredinis]